MRRRGEAWWSGGSVDLAVEQAMRSYGPGYRVTFVRSKPDVVPGSTLALVRWEIVDMAAVLEEGERRSAPLTGASLQAAAYLAEETYP